MQRVKQKPIIMNFKLYRNNTNALYTKGNLFFYEEVETQTLEPTASMLPAGLYTLRLVTIHAHRRDLEVFDFHTGQATGWRISHTATSHIGCIREQAIAIGQELIPGALFKAQEALLGERKPGESISMIPVTYQILGSSVT